MALFSRRSKDAPEPQDAAGNDPVTDADAADATASAEPQTVESVPEVSISVSTFRGAGGAPAAPAREPAASGAFGEAAAPAPLTGRQMSGNGEPPAQTETIPGLRDNMLLREALAQVTPTATPVQLLEVARQILQGHLFLRVKGDARSLLAEGKGIPLAVGRSGDDQYVLAFSSGTALQAAMAADGETGTSAMGQPVLTVLQHVLNGPFTGLLLDGASGSSRAVLPRAVLEPAVAQADPQLRIKTLLATSPRTPDVAARLGEALAEAPLWVAVNTTKNPDGTERMGVAEARTSDGGRLVNVFSHPLEVVAMARGDRALPFTGAQLGRALRSDAALTGVLVDAAGPWMVLSRDDLAPVLALPDPPAPAAGAAPGADSAPQS